MELGHLISLPDSAPNTFVGARPPAPSGVVPWTAMYGNFELTPRMKTEERSQIRWSTQPECYREKCDGKTPPLYQDPKEQVVGTVQNMRPAVRRPGSILRSKPSEIKSYRQTPAME